MRENRIGDPNLVFEGEKLLDGRGWWCEMSVRGVGEFRRYTYDRISMMLLSRVLSL